MKKIVLFILPIVLLFTSSCETRVKKKFLAIDQQQLEQVDSLKLLNVQLFEEMVTDSLFTARVGLIHSSTQVMLDYLKEYRTDMIAHCTGKNNKIAYMKHDCQMEFSLGENKDGPAYTLERKLNNYIEEMNMIVDGQPFEKIAKSGAEYPEFKDNAQNKEKDFAELSFSDTPLVAAMAITSELTKAVVQAEHTAYSTLLTSHQPR